MSKKLIKTILWNIGTYFCQSSIHGLKYLCKRTDKSVGYTHRIFWLFVIIINCIVCVWLSLWIKSEFDNRITYTFISSNTYHVDNVPFPAVSLCNINKVSKRKFEEIEEILSKNGVDHDEMEHFGASLSSLISHSTFGHDNEHIDNHENIFKILFRNNFTVDTLMDKLQQECDQLLYACHLQSEPANCKITFRRIRTSEGYCCGFNYKGVELFDNNDYISLNNMSVSDDSLLLSGYQIYGGINIAIRIDEDDYMSPSRPLFGAMVLIDDALHYPDSTVRKSTIQTGSRVFLKLRPSVLESTKDIGKLSEEVRNCWFDEELAIMENRYSFPSCIVKCRALTIYETCNCIPFYYPPFVNVVRRQCVLSDNDCLQKNKKLFYSLSKWNRTLGLKCNCRRECNENLYNVETVKGKLNHSIFNRKMRDAAYALNLSTISIFYPRASCSKYKSDVLINWNYLVAIYGGIINLFIGGSILSVFEMLYHFVVKSFLHNKE